MSQNYYIELSGLKCQGCVSALEKSVREFDPMAEVVVDLGNQTAQFSMQESINMVQIKQMIEQLGFKLVNMKKGVPS